METKFIKINGIEWCTENLEVRGKTLFTFDEAKKAADSKRYYIRVEGDDMPDVAEVRLPTIDECKSLSAIPHYCAWSNKGDGVWFSERKEDLKNPEKSLFFPALGVIFNGTPRLDHVCKHGVYWSGSEKDKQFGYSPFFCRINVHYENYSHRSFESPVRCVKK
jgi:hypothetical protein